MDFKEEQALELQRTGTPKGTPKADRSLPLDPYTSSVNVQGAVRTKVD
jgi:hypothetical protein